MSSSKSSVKWFPLPEATQASSSNPKANDHGDVKDLLGTPHTYTTTHDQSSQTADLTITSLLTISPPRHSPEVQTNPSTDDIHSRPKVASSRHSQALPQNKPFYSNESFTTSQKLSSKNSASSLSSRTPSVHNQRDAVTPHTGYALERQSSSTSSASSVLHGRYPPVDTALLSQQVSLLELDKLWRKFLTTSLLGKGKENTESKCTCGATSIRTGEPASMKKDSPSVLPYGSTPGSRDSNKAQTHLMDQRLVERSVQTSQSDLHQVHGTSHHTSPSTSLTTPTPHSPLPPYTPHHPPPIAFTIDSNTGSSPILNTATSSSAHPTHSVPGHSGYAGPLSLSEAFALNRPDFILRSQRRERRVRERGEEKAKMISHLRAQHAHSNRGKTKQDQSQSICSACKLKGRPPQSYYLMVGGGTRPKMNRRKMYETTRRAWENLPEVKRKVEEERRRSQAEINRLRVKLYQKEVLERMRKRNTRTR